MTPGPSPLFSGAVSNSQGTTSALLRPLVGPPDALVATPNVDDILVDPDILGVNADVLAAVDADSPTELVDVEAVAE